MSIKISRYYGVGFALLAVGAVAAMGACSGDATPTPVGGAGAPAGGAVGAGGAGAGGAHAGSTSTAGSSSAGAAAAGAAGAACGGMKPASALITSFNDLVADDMNAGNFKFMEGIPGGTYAYQPNALKVTATPEKALNVKGNIANYDGFGVYLNFCNDASAYTGISFNIKGNVGPSGKLNFRVQTNSNTATTAANIKAGKGTCVVPPSTSDSDAYAMCHASSKDIMVTAVGGVVNVKFSDLMDGIPVSAVSGKERLDMKCSRRLEPSF